MIICLLVKHLFQYLILETRIFHNELECRILGGRLQVKRKP